VSGLLALLDRISIADEDRLGASVRATASVERKVMPACSNASPSFTGLTREGQQATACRWLVVLGR
jgi:hypothetical protein